MKLNFFKNKNNVFYKILKKLTKFWFLFIKMIKFFKKKKLKIEKKKFFIFYKKILTCFFNNFPLILPQIKYFCYCKKKLNWYNYNSSKWKKKKEKFLNNFCSLFINYIILKFSSSFILSGKRSIQNIKFNLVFLSNKFKNNQFYKKSINIKFILSFKNLFLKISRKKKNLKKNNILYRKNTKKNLNCLYISKYIYILDFYKNFFKKKKLNFEKSQKTQHSKQSDIISVYQKKKNYLFKIQKILKFIYIFKLFLSEKNDLGILSIILKNSNKILKKKFRNKTIFYVLVLYKYTFDMNIHFNVIKKVYFMLIFKNFYKLIKFYKIDNKLKKKYFSLLFFITILSCEEYSLLFLYISAVIKKTKFYIKKKYSCILLNHGLNYELKYYILINCLKIFFSISLFFSYIDLFFTLAR